MPNYNFLYYYDGDGNLVKKVEPDGSYTLYIAGVYEVRKSAAHAVTGTTTYYPAGGAVRVTTETPHTEAVYYVLGDQLGSTSVVTDASGAVVSMQGYYPFGESRYTTGSLFTDKLYTGQQQVTSLGLLNYKARYYDAYLNRFTQPDSIIPNLYDPQSLNRYSYARNNPIRYNDPSGHCASGAVVDTVFCIWVGMMVAGAVIDAGINVINQVEDTGHVDVNQVVEHAVQGAVIGGAPLVAAFAAPAVVGAAGETLASAGESLEYGGITNAGIKTMAASSSMSDWLWKASVTAATGDSSLFTLPKKLTSGTLASGGQTIDLQSGENGPGLLAKGGPRSGFDSYTKTHVEGHAAAWMEQNGATTGTLFINNSPCLNCARNLPNMLPPESSLRIIGPNWYDKLFLSAK